MEDSELVSRALLRDQQAFAALYDRYADRLFDYARRQTGNTADAGDIVQDTFVLAIQRLHQLRDPNMVRPWLYAIVRSEVHRRHRRLNRLQFTEPDEQAAMSSDGPSADDLVHQQELRTLFTEAANGLDPADREVLDLHLRHRLTGAEIAATLGIPERQVSVTVQRVRERLARSIGVVLLARNPACGELAELQRTEGTALTVLSRKRLARHIDGCATCSQQLHDRMRPETLLAALPIALAPAAWRADVLQRMALAGGSGGVGDGGRPQRPLRRREGTRVWQHADGFPRPATSTRLLAAIAVGLLASLLLVGIVVVRGGDSAKRVTAGATTTVATAEKPTNGTDPTDTTDTNAVTTTAASTTTTATTVAPTTLPATTVATTVAATLPPTVPPTAPPTVPPDTSPPTFQSASAGPGTVTSMHPDGSPMCSPDVEALTTTLTVNVTDDRGVTGVSVHFVAAGVVGDRSLGKSGNSWQVTIGPFPAASVPTGNHPISVTFTAVDAAGNSKTLNNGSIATLVGCPIVN